jgi:hypothetical protein
MNWPMPDQPGLNLADMSTCLETPVKRTALIWRRLWTRGLGIRFLFVF